MLRKIYRAVVPGFIRRGIRKVRNIPSLFREFREEYTARSITYSYYALMLDWMMCSMFLGASPNDYFKYRFYEKSRRFRRQFVTLGRSRFLIRSFNDGSEDQRKLVEDKTIFAHVFADMTKRKILSSEDLAYEAFTSFLASLGRVIIKPADGYNGNGIYILRASDGEEAIRQAYGSFSQHKYTIEEVLEQDGILRELNPGTVNTMRVNVINNNGQFEIQNAVLRTGQGNKPVDNLSSGGLVSKIDVETGIIISLFCDVIGQRLLRHPLTGTIMIGQKIPLWDKVRETAIEGARRISKVRYTSWDIAVIKGGDVAVVEGNTYGNFQNQQIVDQTGVWEQYKKYL